jgi:hypothetical protein
MKNSIEEIQETFSARGDERSDNEVERTVSNGDRKNNYLARFARKVKNIAGTVREKSLHETVRQTTNKVADKLENAGKYIEERKFQELPTDVVTFVQKHPLQWLLLFAGLGYYLIRRRRR